ncbi:MAG: thiamine pyrophosphate-binding protein, partial [Planctomycetota bacterium]
MQQLSSNLALSQAPSVRVPIRPPAVKESTIATALVRCFADLGVEQAFGVHGRGLAPFFDALEASESIEPIHFHHEAGAVHAAAEACFAGNRPALVYTTSGPGTINSLSGIMAARGNGAKVILVSAATDAGHRGRWAVGETSSYTFPQNVLNARGRIFDFALRLEDPGELGEVMRRLRTGLSRPGGFVAHLSLSREVQNRAVDLYPRGGKTMMTAPAVNPRQVAECLECLEAGPFAVWVGAGAAASAPLVKALVERTGARVFCSPRGKGIIPEDHPRFLGVTGIGCHQTVVDYMLFRKPSWVLVLGTRLGEATSLWDRDMMPAAGFIHVDIDADVPGTAYPEARTLAVHADVGTFLRTLLERLPKSTARPPAADDPFRAAEPPILMRLKDHRPVRLQLLMQAVQRHVVRRGDALVLSDDGFPLDWSVHHLRFPAPGRYRINTFLGSRGSAVAGVVGAALAAGGRKAVALLGDHATMIGAEMSTAVRYAAPVVWIVLKDVSGAAPDPKAPRPRID